MSWLDQVTPTNLLAEKEKFLADPTYNPQFTYSEPIDEESFYKYGKTKPKYVELANNILEKTYFGRNEADLLMMEGPRISQDEVTKRFQTFFEMHGIEHRFKIVWSSSFISRATINDDTLKLRTNATFHKEGLIGLMYHEIGTHALRTVNYENQPWFKKKKQFGLTHNYLKTEEGLAALHALLPHTYKSAYTSAIRYIAVDYARTHSFVELWQFLGTYVQDPETRWMITLRQKRGMTDTSQPGGPTKDLVYFEGVVDVWLWLEQRQFDCTPLYFGKCSYEDVDLVMKLNPDYQPILPYFFTKDREEYAQLMTNIGEFNELREMKS